LLHCTQPIAFSETVFFALKASTRRGFEEAIRTDGADLHRLARADLRLAKNPALENASAAQACRRLGNPAPHGAANGELRWATACFINY
jgi:hypothetical protein